MRFDVITLFPEMFSALNYGINGRAIKKGLVDLNIWNLRDFTDDRYQMTDDRPYGGGPGMLMMAEPLVKTIDFVKSEAPKSKTVFLNPGGALFTQKKAKKYKNEDGIIFISGRYEGIDERVIEKYIDEEISVGDYILSGGELPAMTVIDSIIRLIPNVLNNADSIREESFEEGLLDYPSYTRPESILGKAIPEVLKSGDHGKINNWRSKQALIRTWLKRPDLLERKKLTEKERSIIEDFLTNGKS
tara:strand:+ start:7364 stop:8098 length:735 start_codon:yes stop_codon:yes gene_type:complete